MKKMITRFIVGAALLGAQAVYSQNLPKGFSIEKVCDLKSATCYAFAPDGRIFIGEQEGIVKVFKNKQLLPTPAITMNSVKSVAEKGLIGMAIDPDFATNGYLFIYYTKNASCNSTGCPYDLEIELKRFTIKGDEAVAGEDVVLFNSGRLSRRWELWNHNGGGMRFGADKKLYVAIGYNEDNNAVGDFEQYHGKVLRLNNDGSTPTDNPFYNAAASKVNNSIYAYGFRNPYTLHHRKGTNTLYLTDVGSGQGPGREEINEIKPSGNYGYPDNEGYVTSSDYVSPIYCYESRDQGSTTLETINGCAITGGTFFSPNTTNYPESLKNTFFFNDFCNGWISYLDFSGDKVTRMPFATGLGKSREGSGMVAMEEGLDGNIYFITRLTQTAKPSGAIATDAKTTLNRIVYDPALAVAASNELLLHCTIQPIPANSYFSINLISATSGKAAVDIIDMLGVTKQSNSYDVMQGENENDVDISTLPKGTYLVNIKTDGRVANKKLVIE